MQNDSAEKPPMEPYKPTPHDLQWSRNLLAMLKDGGTWAIPKTGSIYTVDKNAKTLTCTHGYDATMHNMVTGVFNQLGYALVVLCPVDGRTKMA